VAALQKEVDFRNQRISEIQADLANEIELNKLGKASNIREQQDRLNQEKALRDKAEEEKKKAAETQFALDTALQASNLITAISSLYSSLSGIGFGAGVAIATALSAVLIGSFIASKSQAAQVAGFEKGGLVEGKEQLIRINENGQEFVIDAQTTKELGLNKKGSNMSDFKSIIGSHQSDIPDSRHYKKANKRANKIISKNNEARQQAILNSYEKGVTKALQGQNGILRSIALQGQNGILRSILKATENTPVVFPRLLKIRPLFFLLVKINT